MGLKKPAAVRDKGVATAASSAGFASVLWWFLRAPGAEPIFKLALRSDGLVSQPFLQMVKVLRKTAIHV
jgi:hypothetical protein